MQAHEKLLGGAEGMVYLEERKINLETASAFKLGLKVDSDRGRWLVIPHFVKGKPININYRSLPPAEKSFRWVEGYPSAFFNEDALEGAESFLFARERSTL